MEWGAAFDRDADGAPALAIEGAHSARRVLHARDATGREIGRVLWRRASALAKRPDLGPRARGRALIVDEDGGAAPARGFCTRTGRRASRARGSMLLATGGAGQVYSETTNPPVATGDGVAMAYRAGAAVADLEFVQFHPTALEGARAAAVPAVGGAARRRGAAGQRERASAFMPRYDPAGDLAPRDRVARGIEREARRTGAPVYLSLAAPRPGLRARAVSVDLGGVPRGRARSGARSDPGRSRRALRDGRRRRPISTAGRRSPASSPPARWPAPASTAPTGWPATRCSRGSSSAPAPAGDARRRVRTAFQSELSSRFSRSSGSRVRALGATAIVERRGRSGARCGATSDCSAIAIGLAVGVVGSSSRRGRQSTRWLRNGRALDAAGWRAASLLTVGTAHRARGAAARGEPRRALPRRLPGTRRYTLEAQGVGDDRLTAQGSVAEARCSSAQIERSG